MERQTLARKHAAELPQVVFQTKLCFHLRGEVTCVNIFQKNCVNGSFSGFLYEFDMYRGHSNKTNSTFGVSGLVAMLCSTLPKQKNLKEFAENSFYQSTITHRAPQIKQYLVYWNYSGIMFKKLPSVGKKDIKKKRRGSFGYHTEENRKTI